MKASLDPNAGAGNPAEFLVMNALVPAAVKRAMTAKMFSKALVSKPVPSGAREHARP